MFLRALPAARRINVCGQAKHTPLSGHFVLFLQLHVLLGVLGFAFNTDLLCALILVAKSTQIKIIAND